MQAVRSGQKKLLKNEARLICYMIFECPLISIFVHIRMKTSSFFYPYESTFRLLRSILVAKGYEIITLDVTEGIIKAHKPGLFKKGKNLDVLISKTDHTTTNIKIMLNGNQHLNGKPLNLNSVEEEKLMDSIHRHF